jgi:poly(3-hydroxybutyrate) depolymerase
MWTTRLVDGMDHCWPSGDCLNGPAPTDIQASERIIEFFGSHALP